MLEDIRRISEMILQLFLRIQRLKNLFNLKIKNYMKKETHAMKSTRWMKAVALSFFALLLCSVNGYAQNMTVTGRVSLPPCTVILCFWLVPVPNTLSI